MAFLPVFFVNLDPDGIPSSAELEVFRPHTMDTVSRAVVSLDAISRIYPPIDFGLTLWPRAWPWLDFIHTHWTNLPGVPLIPESTFYANFIKFSGNFHDHPDTYSIMSATSGFRVMVSKAWTFLPAIAEPRRELLLSDLSGFIADSSPGNPANRAELLEGAGGTLDDLASLVVEYLYAVAKQDSPLIPGSTASHISRLLSFLKAFDLYPDSVEDQEWKTVPLGPLVHESLLRNKFMEALVAAMVTLAGTPGPETRDALDECFMLLGRILLSAGGHLWLGTALQSGLLRVIVICATAKYGVRIHRHFRFLLCRIIPTAFLYYHNVVQLEIALADIDDLVSADTFRESKIFGDWETFVAVAEERIEVLSDLEGGEYMACKACDNLKCNKIAAKTDFWRCSGCQVFYYCCQDCQVADWKQGGHRTACRQYRSLSLNEPETNLFTREREFLRALIQRDYQSSITSICADQIAFMAAHPASEDDVFITLFDYFANPVKIEIHSATDSPLAAILLSIGEEWTDMVARAKRSDGRLHLHVVRAFQSREIIRYWVVPLRTETANIRDGLRDLVPRGPIMQNTDGKVPNVLVPFVEESLYAIH
ncbi:hypothetical protein B0H11DRAFT_2254649 [Mycena galericulata]|nr:hypothetical protein B0H11DRAFT_2254649 [Mycena galericulata]